MPVQTRTRDDALRLGVNINKHNHALPDSHHALLFTKRQQQILRQSPIKKSTDAVVDAHDFHGGKLADGGERSLRRGYEAIFGIAIDEHIEFVLGLEVRGDVATG